MLVQALAADDIRDASYLAGFTAPACTEAIPRGQAEVETEAEMRRMPSGEEGLAEAVDPGKI